MLTLAQMVWLQMFFSTRKTPTLTELYQRENNYSGPQKKATTSIVKTVRNR